jgi:hypothetical protein
MATGNITTALLTKKVTIDSDLSNKEYHLVDWDATDLNVVNLVEDALSMPMVLIEAGDGSTTATKGTVALSGITKVKIGGTVAAGDSLAATTAGVAIATTTDGNRAAGIALEGGASGDIIEMLVAPHFVYVA